MKVEPALLTDLLSRAAAEPAREICGLLFGDAQAIAGARPAANVAADPSRWFEIDPAALIAAHKAERAGGPKLIGHYHSHPNGRAEPSPRDLAAARPGLYWLILAGGTARLWFAEPGRFREVTLTTG